MTSDEATATIDRIARAQGFLDALSDAQRALYFDFRAQVAQILVMNAETNEELGRRLKERLLDGNLLFDGIAEAIDEVCR